VPSGIQAFCFKGRLRSMSFIHIGPGRPFLSAKQRITCQRRTCVSRWREASAVLFPLQKAPGRPGKTKLRRSEPAKSARVAIFVATIGCNKMGLLLAQPPARRAIAQSAGWVNEANLTSAEANQVMLFLQVSLAAIHGFPGP